MSIRAKINTMSHKIRSIITISITIILFTIFASYIVYLEYNKDVLIKKIDNLQAENQTYLNEFDKLKNIAASSTLGFNDLYTTLSKVIQEDGLKNKTLEEKLMSLDKLTRSDPQLLKKYSKIYFLNENYTPREIGDISSDYIFNKKVEYRLHVDVIYFLLSMIDDAKKEGLNPLVISAYRSFDSQTNLKVYNKVTYGSNTANRFVAEQGYSEHQLGTTVDLTIPSIGNASTAFDKTREYAWLQNNAYKYGFVLSYPKGNAYYAYEPWHWRFVGIDLATHLYQDKIYFYNLDQRKIDDYLLNIFDK